MCKKTVKKLYTYTRVKTLDRYRGRLLDGRNGRLKRKKPGKARVFRHTWKDIHNNNIVALYYRPASAHVPLILLLLLLLLLLCAHDSHCCDARAKKKSMRYIFSFKGKWVPPTQYHPRAERPVPVRYIYFTEIQPPVLSCPSCAIL